MAKENYVAIIDNVECIVKFVNQPKDEKHGYSYALNVQNPAKELLPYLTQDKYHSIKMFTFDKEPRFAENQKITFLQMGITEWGEGKFSAHNIPPEKEQVFQGTKSTSIAPTITQTITPMPKDSTVEETQKMWDGKEKRDFRGRAIMYALQCFPPRSPESSKTELEFADEVIMLAECKFLQYIYDGYGIQEPF